MASGLVASLLSSASKLLDLLRGAPPAAAPRRRSVSSGVRRLQRLLGRIQATLDDAGERVVQDRSVKLWIAELTEVARDAEDVLDDYRYELIRRRVQDLQGSGGADSSTSCKRKHEEDRGICERISRKITSWSDISTERAAVQLRLQEDDGGSGTSEEIVEITRWFEETSSDQTIPQHSLADEDDDISERIEDIIRQFEEISRDRAALQLRPEDGERITRRERDSQWEPRVPKMAKISDVKRAKENGIAYFQSCEHILLDICPEEGPELVLSPDNWLPSGLRLLNFGVENANGVPSFHRGLSTLDIGKLEIRGCPKLEALMDLEELKGLHSLISDCKGLINIGGMRCLSNLESLVLLHCPLLELRELLPVIPEYVAVFLCPKVKKWCEIQSIEYLESLPDPSHEVNV
nr:unnamed protein product [Digitaria exilis]